MTHLIHIPVDPVAFGRWAGHRDLTVGGVFDESHACHVLLSGLFGKGAFQPYRLFSPEVGGWSLYGCSQSSAEDLMVNADLVGTPEMLAVVDLDGVKGKVLPESFRPGLRIGFDLRICPTRRKGNLEQDAYLSEARYLFPENPKGMHEEGITRADVYGKWLGERLGEAAVLESFRIASFRRRKMVRSGSVFEGPEVVAQGTVQVKDPEEFRSLVHGGIGRGKAYGFGMFLLRPADAEAQF